MHLHFFKLCSLGIILGFYMSLWPVSAVCYPELPRAHRRTRCFFLHAIATRLLGILHFHLNWYA